ncbi:nucleoside hydrolase-like [Topomyia yanbarensis]|uniref:nucleoside hydrolase-like n=1 Tax=Topomyia yanbarensis TaxID=2498891 RepID=UPI00273C3E89|nr:nucleoside hydrolase-like [Topomyia yanbarensis]
MKGSALKKICRMEKISLIALLLAALGVLVIVVSTNANTADSKTATIRRVIVDVDAGPDDAWAVYHLLKTPGVHVEAISCVRGNSNVTNVGRNVLRILTAIGKEGEIPVYLGSNERLITHARMVEPENMYFGSDGFSDIQFEGSPPDMSLLRSDALTELFKLIGRYRNEITFISLGPLTNLALLFKVYPDTRQWIKELYIMGGNRHGVGNTQNAAEFNFFNDPEAASIVINGYLGNINILPWETASRDNLVMNQTWRFDVLGNSNNPVVQILNPVERKPLGENDNWMPCDVLVAMSFTHPDLVIERKRYPADVELHGWLTRGQLVLDHGNEGTGNVTIIDNMETAGVVKILMHLASV